MTREKATNYLRDKYGKRADDYIARCEESEGQDYWLEFDSLDELVADFEFDQRD